MSQRYARLRARLLPSLAFSIFLLLGWQNWNLETLPAYGDVLEPLWGWQWYARALAEGISPLFTDFLFFPEGWHTATFPHSPYFLLATLPLYGLAGGPFAYNVISLLYLVIAFGGTYRLARLFLRRGPATLAALTYTFSFPVFVRVASHLNVLGGLCWMPWLLWALLRLARTDPAHTRDRLRWVVIAGLAWGLSVNLSFYFLHLGAVMLALVMLFAPVRAWGARGRLVWFPFAAAIAGIALLFNLPYFLLFLQARAADQVAFVDMAHITGWGASANSLFIPSRSHRLLGGIADALYAPAHRSEADIMNLGMIVPLLAGFGAWHGLRKRRALLLTAIGVTGLVLALGPYLRWSGGTVSLPGPAPLNEWLWRIGHALKPALFPTGAPPPALANGLPLPEFFLLLVVPLWEGVRTVARYAFLTVLVMPLLAGTTVSLVTSRSLQAALVALWLLEIMPVQLGLNQPLWPPHPAHAWLAQQEVESGLGIAEFESQWLAGGAQVALSARHHGLPNVSGLGSQMPVHTAFLDEWVRANGLLDPDLAPLLRAYRVRYALLHLTEAEQAQILPGLERHEMFELVGCFRQRQPSPWFKPICILAVEAPQQQINVIPEGGWYDPEWWGVWADGSTGRARWVATASAEHRLEFEAFPICSGRPQTVTVAAGGTVIGRHQWDDCETWQGHFDIPADLVEVGWNQLTFTFSHAARPAQFSDGENPDNRLLAAGFSRLEVVR